LGECPGYWEDCGVEVMCMMMGKKQQGRNARYFSNDQGIFYQNDMDQKKNANGIIF